MKFLYELKLTWTGNLGEGTKTYTDYERSYEIVAQGKPKLLGSSEPKFRGDAKKWNPEELLLAALSSCHMLWYLHLCADNHIIVSDYSDHPQAMMIVESLGSGRFKEATLNPKVVIADASQLELAKSLHKEAHKKCFIANSINFPLNIVPSAST